MATGPVVVFGGTGHYGRWIVASLVRRGTPVRVVSRNPEAARKIVGEAPAIVEGDIVSENAVALALEGGSMLEYDGRVELATGQADVSFTRAQDGQRTPLGRWRGQAGALTPAPPTPPDAR